jgi:TolB protein
MRSPIGSSHKAHLAALSVLLALAALLAPTRKSFAQTPVSGSYIAFSAGSGPDLWVVDTATNREWQVTSGLRVNNPAWSPSRTQIAFSDSARGNGLLYVNVSYNQSTGAVQQVGSAVRLTDSNGQDLGPEWGPSGLIAFFSNRSGSEQIWAINPSVPNGEFQVTHQPNHCYWPTWSPDGTKIAFVGVGTDGKNYLWTVAPSPGATPVPLAGMPSAQVGIVDLEWSPDGTRIAGHGSDGQIYILTIGVGWQKLISGTFPSWSPDGGRLVIERVSNGGAGTLYLISASGTPLSGPLASGDRPAWNR